MRVALAALIAALLTGCGSGGSTTSTPATPRAPAFRLSSPAFTPGAPIPARYTCAGANLSLPLRWSGVPRGTRELVLIMRDPDAPGGNFIHWALAGISPRTMALPSGAAGFTRGRNSFGSLGYRGPCPPEGDPPHRYVISLTALLSPSGLGPGFSAAQFKLSRPAPVAMLSGTFARR